MPGSAQGELAVLSVDLVVVLSFHPIVFIGVLHCCFFPFVRRRAGVHATPEL